MSATVINEVAVTYFQRSFVCVRQCEYGFIRDMPSSRAAAQSEVCVRVVQEQHSPVSYCSHLVSGSISRSICGRNKQMTMGHDKIERTHVHILYQCLLAN